MTPGRRAFVLVLDAVGIGALPDAADYGDAGAHTLRHLAEAEGRLDLPHFEALGLGNIDPLPGVPPAGTPAIHGRLHPLGPGKDSATGHWQLMGAIPREPLPTYPDGFPDEVVAIVAAALGAEPVGNRVSDGVAVLDELGGDGRPILYTSVDSVLQIAAHVDVLAEADLQAACARVRAALPPEHAVGRVIARPFAGEPGAFERTPGRRDFTVPPPGTTALDVLHAAGVGVHGVGKIADLFAGRGITASHPGATNAAALASTTALVDGLDAGAVVVNLVETDQVYGHRKDVGGFHRALREIDAAVGAWDLGPEDLLILTSDHGCDPALPHADHTREYALLLATPGAARHDGPMADVGQSLVTWLLGTPSDALPGASFV